MPTNDCKEIRPYFGATELFDGGAQLQAERANMETQDGAFGLPQSQ